MGDKAKSDNLDALCPDSKKKLEELDLSGSMAISGIGGLPKYEGSMGYWEVPSEHVIYSPNQTSRIVLGRDRPHSIFSGYGGTGDSHCGSVTLTAGPLGHYAKMCGDDFQPILSEPNFKNDAATIHMSQKTDIDMNFGLTVGKVGNPRTKSGIAIKADGVRIIGREGIKLVTKTDDKNSQAGNAKTTPGIDLIAGNDDADLQPLVKGKNLVKSLNDIRKSIQQLSGVVTDIMAQQQRMNAVLAGHVHTGPTGITFPSVEVAISAMAETLGTMALTLPSSINQKINVLLGEIDEAIAPMRSRGETLLNKYNNTN